MTEMLNQDSREGNDQGLTREAVAFGPPLEYPAASTSKEVLQEVTDHYVQAIEGLRATMERAVSSGRGRRG